MDLWHTRPGHFDPNAVANLDKNANGVLVQDQASYDEDCTICRQSNAKNIVSRRPNPPSMIPHEEIWFDLIEMEEGPDKESLMLYFLNDC